MIMDELRSHHIGPALMVTGSGEQFWVRWYPAAPGALAFPGLHAFGSMIWESNFAELHTGVGMQFPTPGMALADPAGGKRYTRYRWRRKRYPAPPGQHFRGLAEWFRHGLPADQLAQPPYTDLCGTPLMTEDGLAEPGGDDDVLGGQIFAGVALGDPSGDDDITQGPPVPTFQLTKSNLGALSGTIDDLTLPDSAIYTFSCASPVTITGLSAGVQGQLVVLENQGPAQCTLSNLDGGSSGPNQLTTDDGVSEVLWQGTTCWLCYNLSDAKWRVAGIMPAPKAKGGLSTASDSRVSVLAATGTLGHVLNQRPAELTGMSWGDLAGGSAGGGDLNYYRCREAASYPGTFRYYQNSYAFTRNTGPMSPDPGKIFLHPFVSPRGGVLDRIIAWCPFSGLIDSHVVLGIYEQGGGLALEPIALQVAIAEQTVNVLGEYGADIDFRCDPDRLYWLAFSWDGLDVTTQWHGWTTPPNPFWPLFGSDNTLVSEPNAPLMIIDRLYAPTLPSSITPVSFPPTSNVPLVGVRYGS